MEWKCKKIAWMEGAAHGAVIPHMHTYPSSRVTRRGEGRIYLFLKEIDGTKAGRQRHNPQRNSNNCPGLVLSVPYPSGTQAGVGGGATWGKESTSPYAGGTPVGTLDIAIGDAATGSKFEQKIGDVMRQYNYNVP